MSGAWSLASRGHQACLPVWRRASARRLFCREIGVPRSPVKAVPAARTPSIPAQAAPTGGELVVPNVPQRPSRPRAWPPDGGRKFQVSPPRIGLTAVALYGLRSRFDAIRHRPHLRRMTHLELNDMQTEVLIRELSSIVQNDRYPLSPRIRVLKEILGMMRPEPARPAPLPPLRN
jgi:hypothetical protein